MHQNSVKNRLRKNPIYLAGNRVTILDMITLDSYLAEYKESHENPVNIKIHFICVPLIMWSLIGFLHTFVVAGIPLSYLFVAGGLLYYLSFRNIRVFFAMTLVTLFMLATFAVVPELRIVSIAVFVAAWLGQFYGHKVEGKKPSFFKDLVFLLIGPVWIIKKIFPKFI